MEKLTRNIYPGVLVGIVIIILLGLPGSCFPKVKPIGCKIELDKLVHVLLFTALSFASIWGFRKEYRNQIPKERFIWLILTFCISVCFGTFTEIAQMEVFSGRTGCIEDLEADCVGSVIGLLLFALTHQKCTKMPR